MRYIVEVWHGRSAFGGLVPWAFKVHCEECYSRRDAEKCARDIESTDKNIVCYIVEEV